MACSQCIANPRRDGLCERCFARRVQKRITKALRGAFEERDSLIFLRRARDAPTLVLEHILRHVLSRSNREVLVDEVAPAATHRVVSADTVDVVLVRAMDAIARLGELPPADGVLRPLSRVSLEECELVARTLGLPFVSGEHPVFTGLDALEGRQPGTKATLAKALGLL